MHDRAKRLTNHPLAKNFMMPLDTDKEMKGIVLTAAVLVAVIVAVLFTVCKFNL